MEDKCMCLYKLGVFIQYLCTYIPNMLQVGNYFG